MENVLLYFSLKYNGDWDKIYRALESKEKITHKELEGIAEKINCEFITILSPLYPNYLKNTHKPPFVIYFKGDISLLGKYHKTVALVGGTNINDYGKNNIEKLLKDFQNEEIVISTLEINGINLEVLDVGLKNSNQVILVLKSDMKSYIKKILDLKEKKDFLAITEIYEISKNFESKINDYSNRLICGISKGIIFIQFKNDDSINKLFSFAVNEGKEVFAIPDCLYGMDGTNKLIKNGAKLIENAKDVLNDL